MKILTRHYIILGFLCFYLGVLASYHGFVDVSFIDVQFLSKAQGGIFDELYDREATPLLSCHKQNISIVPQQNLNIVQLSSKRKGEFQFQLDHPGHLVVSCGAEEIYLTTEERYFLDAESYLVDKHDCYLLDTNYKPIHLSRYNVLEDSTNCFKKTKHCLAIISESDCHLSQFEQVF